MSKRKIKKKEIAMPKGIGYGKKKKTKKKKKNVTKINNDEKKYIYKVAKEQGHKKVMICGGLCNSCTRIGHACGSEVFDEYAIVIPIHG